MPKERLGRVLGSTKNHGNIVTQWVLTDKGTVLPCRIMGRLNDEEIHSPTEMKKREVFDSMIQSKLGDSIVPPPAPIDENDTQDEDEAFTDEAAPSCTASNLLLTN